MRTGLYTYTPAAVGGDWHDTEPSTYRVLTGKTRSMRPDGIGDTEPHVRVYTGSGTMWFPVSWLKWSDDQTIEL